MNTREQIIKNLEGRVYGVNVGVAIAGTGSDGPIELNKMVREGIVEQKNAGSYTSLPLFRLSFAVTNGIIPLR